MSATIIAFPQPPHAARFSPADHNAILAGAMAISLRWGAMFYEDDGVELVTVGRASGGDGDAQDAFGLMMVPGGVELVAFDAPNDPSIYSTVGRACEAMRALAVL